MPAFTPDATDPDLRTRIDTAKLDLKQARKEQLQLEHRVRDGQGQRERKTAELRAHRDRLPAQAKTRLDQ